MEKTIRFKCPKCHFTWTQKYANSVPVSSMQRCPNCHRYSEDCIEQSNAWSNMMKETGTKAKFEKK